MGNDQNDKETIAALTKDVKNLLNKFNSAQSENNEAEFLEKNQGKNIVIIMETDKQEEGKLLDIDKFRVMIDRNGKTVHLFKHSIIGYYIAS